MNNNRSTFIIAVVVFIPILSLSFNHYNYYQAPFNRKRFLRNQSNVGKFYNITQKISKNEKIIEKSKKRNKSNMEKFYNVKQKIIKDKQNMHVEDH